MTKNLLTLFLCISFFVPAQSQITWGMAMNLASSASGNMHPRIVNDATGNPLVIWNHSSRAMFSRWNGSSFSTPVMLNTAAMMVAGASWMGPDIAAHGDTVYAVFKLMPEADTSSHIYIVHSFDGGISFSAPVQVDNIADSISRFPTVTIDNSGNPIVAFMKFDGAFMDSRWVVTRSSDFGNTFNTDVKASGWSGGVICDCCPGAIVNTGNSVLMVYRDNNNNVRDEWAGISTDGGNTFTSGMPIDQNNWVLSNCPGSGPDAVIAGDSLYTVYMSAATGSSLVYFSATSISAMQGSIGYPVTGSFAGLAVQNFPRIATDGTAMAIGWQQNVNGTDQFALMFTNDITNGFPAGYDTVDLGDVVNVDLEIVDGKIIVVWEDDNAGTIKYRTGTFNSTTGIKENTSQNHFSIFPNPASGFAEVKFTGTHPESRAVVTDVTGKEILHTDISATENKMLISTQELSNGIYFITLLSENSVARQKISVQH